MIKLGSSRLVILLGNWAIKIPINKCGIKQSYQELKTWDKYQRAPFNKIIGRLFFITIHRRAEPIKPYEIKYLNEYIKIMEKEYPELQFEYGDIWRYENWGRVNSKIVILDYGLSKEIEKEFYN